MMSELTHLSLFSGIGGLDLAAEWAGIKTVGQCEWADYPTKVLEKHWPDVQRWRDIRTLTKESFYERTGLRTVDVISGGFPCQPFSVAGKQRGKEDDRYLWPEMVRVIKELRPTWVVGENVAGIVRMALHDILSELETCGYRTRTFLIPACAVGARHRRYRVAIVANTDCNGCSRIGSEIEERCDNDKIDTAITKGCNDAIDTGRTKDVEHSNSKRCEEQHVSKESDQEKFSCGRYLQGNVCNTTGKGLPDWTAQQMGRQEQKSEPKRSAGWSTESVLGGMADGVPGWLDGDLDFIQNYYWDEEPDIPRVAAGIQNRVNRLKCLGNAVVPQQFYPVFKAIAEIEAVERRKK